MPEWIENEDGPPCKHCDHKIADKACDVDECYEPTVVKLLPSGRAGLMCFAHTGEAGAMFPLPASRPDDWADWDMEMVAIAAGAYAGPAAHEMPKTRDSARWR